MSSLDPPTYLASLQSNIRQRPIPWDGAVRAGSLTDDQLAKIRAVDKAKKDARQQTVEADLDGYRTLFTSVLESAAKRQDVVQYVLVLLNDLLNCTLVPSSRTYRRLNVSCSLPLARSLFLAASLCVSLSFCISASRFRSERKGLAMPRPSRLPIATPLTRLSPPILRLVSSYPSRSHCPLRLMTS